MAPMRSYSRTFIIKYFSFQPNCEAFLIPSQKFLTSSWPSAMEGQAADINHIHSCTVIHLCLLLPLCTFSFSPCFPCFYPTPSYYWSFLFAYASFLLSLILVLPLSVWKSRISSFITHCNFCCLSLSLALCPWTLPLPLFAIAFAPDHLSPWPPSFHLYSNISLLSFPSVCVQIDTHINVAVITLCKYKLIN